MTSNQMVALKHFDSEHIGLSKGSLSLALILTRKARGKDFPLNPDNFKTRSGGQVAGLGGDAAKRILAEHGVERILSNEGGRTSRGNMKRMVAYVEILNELHGNSQLNLEEAEKFWVERIKDYFDAMPFTFKLDPALSLRMCVRALLSQAADRQRQTKGTMYVGAVMQHIVGAKLDIITHGRVKHHGFAVADAPSGRSGDFTHGDVAVHVTTAPGEPLILKCIRNLEVGLRPVIVTTEDGVGGAKAVAKQSNVEERIDVIEVEQFIATNVYEWSGFEREKRSTAVRELFERYNSIIKDCESDPSLRIEFEE